jgi:hypothetical protein
MHLNNGIGSSTTILTGANVIDIVPSKPYDDLLHASHFISLGTSQNSIPLLFHIPDLQNV